MDQAIIDPLFMKSLLGCYKLKRRAKTKVVQDRLFYRQLVKVYSWREQIRQQLHEAECGCSTRCTSTSTSSGSTCSSLCHLTTAMTNSCNSSESTGSCSNQSYELTYSPSDRKSPQTQVRKPNKRRSGKPNVDSLRRKLWLMIVRKEIPHAHKRKTNLRDLKLTKTKSMAQRCVSHLDDFRWRNRMQQSLDSIKKEPESDTIEVESFTKQVISIKCEPVV